MMSTANLVTRATLRALLVAAMSAACVSASGQRAPAAEAATPKAAAAAEKPAAKGDTKPAAEAASVPTKEECEQYVGVLSGGKGDQSLLKDAKVRAIAQSSPDLVTCGAVKKDSCDLCKVLLEDEKAAVDSGFVPNDAYGACREECATFHELRANPKGRGFMFNDVSMQNCKALKDVPCDKIRAAVRSGDPEQCAGIGAVESLCRAQITLDKSLCKAPTGNETFEKHGKEWAEGCRADIDRKAILAKGLKATSESGTPRQRELAKAALGQADACTTYADKAMELCGGSSTNAEKPAEKPAAKE